MLAHNRGVREVLYARTFLVVRQPFAGPRNRKLSAVSRQDAGERRHRGSSEGRYAAWQPKICMEYSSLRVEQEGQEIYFSLVSGATSGA